MKGCKKEKKTKAPKRNRKRREIQIGTGFMFIVLFGGGLKYMSNEGESDEQ